MEPPSPLEKDSGEKEIQPLQPSFLKAQTNCLFQT